jgi:two-component system sensor histidine kinase KdpD
MHRAAAPIDLRTREVDLAALLHAAVDRVDRGENGPSISVRIPDALPAVSLDVRRIGEVIGELVGNAARAAPRGSIVLEAVRDAIGGGVVIRVRDNGVGLSERALQHAFDPFFSEQRAGRRPGLGLANVRRLVEAHGGRISLRNGTDGGAVATIVLPAADAPAGEPSDWIGREAA